VMRARVLLVFFIPLEFFGFFWHFVDLVWIYSFPLLYLLG